MAKVRTAHAACALVASLLALCLRTTPVGATVVRALDDAAVRDHVDLIVTARAVESEVIVDWSGLIFTDTVFRISYLARGNPTSGDIVVRSFTGEWEGVGMHAAGAPSFEVGEDALLLLRWSPGWSRFLISGWHQGAYRLVEREGVLTAEQKPGDGVVVLDGEHEALPARAPLSHLLWKLGAKEHP